MDIRRVVTAGLCTQCGTCAALCPRGAIAMDWSVRDGYVPRVDDDRCNDCGICVDVCPGEGLDFTEHAWWRADNEGVPTQDFLGPWRSLSVGWAADERTRFLGASGGIATAILQGALERDLIDAALVCRTDPEQPLRAEPVVARTPDEVAACRGSKYNVVDTNVLLRRVIDEPGRYALVGLPCHIQGFRLARERSRTLRERVVFTMGIFCGWTAKPRATEVEALRSGLDPRRLRAVSYRGPGWPGPLRLETQAGEVRELAFPDYFYRCVRSSTLLRCRLCPDALAELADLSVGDTWLDRYDGTPGVSDLVVRTTRGERVVEAVAGDRLTLFDSTPDEIVTTQLATMTQKRGLSRGRMWLRRMARRPRPHNPGVSLRPTASDRWAAVRDLAGEAHRWVETVRYPSRS